MGLPEIVDSERLRLPLWTADDIGRLRGADRGPDWHPAFPRDDDRDAASMWHEGDPWGPRSIVLDGVVVGSIGFFGPPSQAHDDVPETEVGYGLVEEARGGGVATEALTVLFGRGRPGRRTHPRQRAPRQRAQHPGARQVRLHRAEGQQRGR